MLMRAMAGLVLMAMAACAPEGTPDASGCRHIGRTGILECR